MNNSELLKDYLLSQNFLQLYKEQLALLVDEHGIKLSTDVDYKLGLIESLYNEIQSLLQHQILASKNQLSLQIQQQQVHSSKEKVVPHIVSDKFNSIPIQAYGTVSMQLIQKVSENSLNKNKEYVQEKQSRKADPIKKQQNIQISAQPQLLQSCEVIDISDLQSPVHQIKMIGTDTLNFQKFASNFQKQQLFGQSMQSHDLKVFSSPLQCAANSGYSEEIVQNQEQTPILKQLDQISKRNQQQSNVSPEVLNPLAFANFDPQKDMSLQDLENNDELNNSEPISEHLYSFSDFSEVNQSVVVAQSPSMLFLSQEIDKTISTSLFSISDDQENHKQHEDKDISVTSPHLRLKQQKQLVVVTSPELLSRQIQNYSLYQLKKALGQLSKRFTTREAAIRILTENVLQQNFRPKVNLNKFQQMTPTRKQSLEERLTEWLKTESDIFQQISSFVPISLSTIMDRLKQCGIKCVTKEFMENFLISQGVLLASEDRNVSNKQNGKIRFLRDSNGRKQLTISQMIRK